MFNIGPQELLLILLVALVIVGPKRLPELSRTIGRGLREFRKAQDEVKKTIRLGLDEAEPTTTRGASRPQAGVARPAGEAAAPAEGSGSAAGSPQDETVDIARSLGRGLAEIRRTRQEIQRTFRVDLSDRPAGAARRPTSAPAAPAAAPSPPAASVPEDASTPPTPTPASKDAPPPPADDGPSD